MRSIISIGICLFLVGFCRAGIIYVDDGASLGGDGASWDTAYRYLQDALASAASGDQIWVAEGLYTPDRDEGGNVVSGDREATFQLKDGVAIYGGFTGVEDAATFNLGDRNFVANESILGGYLPGSDNVFTVVTGSGCDETAVLDGLTITKGHAYTRGDLHSPSHCGAGIYNNSGSPTITNCVFIYNSAFDGGGMYNCNYSSPRVTKCSFNSNYALYSGAGICNSDHSSPTIIDCTFIENSADSSVCGGMLNRNYCSPTVSDCSFIGNTGCGMYNADYSSPTVANCTFVGNSVDNSLGGGMTNTSSSSPWITNCIFSGNSSHYGGAGMGNSNSSSPVVTNCVFSGNRADSPGGGMLNRSYCSPTVTHCTFVGNSASRGAGICNYYNSSATVTNCILWDDRQYEIYNYHGCSAEVSYSDILGFGQFPGIGNIVSDPMFSDPGHWNASDVWVEGDYHLLPGSPCIDAGDNNSVPADTTDLDGDGNTTEPIPWDLDGNLRVVGGRIDMGAYEYPIPMIELAMKFTPEKVNPGSKGKWVKAHLVLPEGFEVNDVDVNSPLVAQPVGVESDYVNTFINEDDFAEIETAFDRSGFCSIIAGSEPIEVRVIGLLISGEYFYGSDTIRIITDPLKHFAVLSSYWLEVDCGQPNWCGGVDLDQDSAVDFVDFALFDGCCIEVIQ